MAAAALSSVDALVNHSAGGDSKKREWTETFGAGDGAGDFGGAQPAGHDSESFVAKKARLEGAPSAQAGWSMLELGSDTVRL